MKFEYQYDKEQEKVIMELPKDATLSEVLEGFQRFLLAVGYSFEGDLMLDHSEKTNAK